MEVTRAETFGQRVRRLREKRGIRQVDLAASARLSWRHLIRIEQDRGGITKPATVAQLAEALGVPVSDLVDEDEESDLYGAIDSLLYRRVRQILREEARA